jgi:hypothetical protein
MTSTIRSLARPGWLALLLCVSLTACGGDDGGPAGNNGGTPAASELKPAQPGEVSADRPGLRCAP